MTKAAYDVIKHELKTLKASNKALREALEAVEWVYPHQYPGLCPWCYRRPFFSEHAPDCQRQLALATVPEEEHEQVSRCVK